MAEPKSGAERTAASRERARKAEGYDQAVVEAGELRAKVLELTHERDHALEGLAAFQAQQLTWVEQAQAAIAQRDDAISVLGQQLAQLRARLVPPAQPAPARAVPDNFFVRPCPRCGGRIEIPRGNNHVIARDPVAASSAR